MEVDGRRTMDVKMLFIAMFSLFVISGDINQIRKSLGVLESIKGFDLVPSGARTAAEPFKLFLKYLDSGNDPVFLQNLQPEMKEAVQFLQKLREENSKRKGTSA